MEKNKNVYVYAYTKMNLGDDLFIKMLCDRYPNVNFKITSYKKFSKGLMKVKNLKIKRPVRFIDSLLNRLNLQFRINEFLIKNSLRSSDCVVHIGGSIFMQDIDWKRNVQKYNKNVSNSKKYYIIGSNFGPYQDDGFKSSYNEIFSKVEDVCFRDEYSYNLFPKLKNIRYESDVVFALDYDKNITEEKRAIISIIDLDNRPDLIKYQEIYARKMAELSKTLSSKGYEVILMGFCTGEGDSKMISKIMTLIDNRHSTNIKEYNYDGDLEGALSLIKKSRVIFAARFHAMILGWVYNKKVYPIIYSNKSLNVIEDLKFEGDYIHINEINKLDCIKAVDNLEYYKEFDIDEQRLSGERQFKKLDEFLK